MRLIDANVFIYASGRDHPYKESCVHVLASAQRGRLEANTDVEVFQEILHYYHARRDIGIGEQALSLALAQYPEAILINSMTMRLALGVVKSHPHLQARDAVHAAVVIENGLEGIISADRGFDDITGITRFDPKEF